MVRLADLPDAEATFLRERACPAFGPTALVKGPALAKRRVVLISTAGLRRIDDRPFGAGSVDYRIVPLASRNQVVQDHVSATHDRSGFTADVNVVLPLDRLLELQAEGVVGEVADLHYSFMGATAAIGWEPAAQQLAGVLRRDGVDAAVLCPV